MGYGASWPCLPASAPQMPVASARGEAQTEMCDGDSSGHLGRWPLGDPGLASQEDAPAWRTFVGALYPKGVTEDTTQLVVSDGAKGLDKALYSHLYGVPQQRYE
jgi:hypothetical protein